MTGPLPTDEESDSMAQFQSKATLIVCPNHLAIQWYVSCSLGSHMHREQEVRKHIGETATVIVMTTKEQWGGVTYGIVRPFLVFVLLKQIN